MMRQLASLSIFTALGLCHPALHTQVGAGALVVADAKEQILALDRQLNTAAVNGDLKFFAKVMSDDYIGVAPNGIIIRKSMIAAHYQEGSLHYDSVVSSDVEVHIHDDCAILTAVTAVKGRDGGIDLSGTYRITRVFLERHGDWEVAAFQATPMRSAAID
jgi:ketosteroid isomerase-like protein